MAVVKGWGIIAQCGAGRVLCWQFVTCVSALFMDSFFEASVENAGDSSLKISFFVQLKTDLSGKK